MKKLSLTLFTLLSAVTFSPVQAADESAYDLHKSVQSSSHYAYAYANASQVGIGPGDVVKVTTFGVHGRDFDLTPDGGVVFRKRGDYMITYQALISSQGSLALFKNGNLIPETAFSNIATTAPVLGTMIISVNNKDVITLRSIENFKTFNTIAPVTITASTIPVVLVIQRLNDD